MPCCVMQLFESLLPARSATGIVHGENAEEVRLCEFDSGHDDDEIQSKDSDSDEETVKTGNRRVRCAHQ